MNKEYQTKKLNIFRTKKVFSIGFIISDIIIWTNIWFKFVTIEEEKYKSRYMKYNESYPIYYWSKWYYGWTFNKIIN